MFEVQERFGQTERVITVYAVKKKGGITFSLYIIEDVDNGNGMMQIIIFL